jgi:transcriptional regulator with XRE-family HTH domain
MSIEIQVNLRTRKLGVLIKDARLASHKSIPECAEAVGIGVGILRAYEEGRRAPSLPELELLAYYLNLPMSHFWSKDIISDNLSPLATINVPVLIGIRHRMIGAMLRKQRLETGVSLKSLAEQSGIPSSRLKAYEMGESAIPAPILEGLMSILDARIESLFDQTGPIGQWLVQKKVVQEFLQLPPDLQSFVCKPVNRPYIELALSLSGLSTDKLRSVAETLLDITL